MIIIALFSFPTESGKELGKRAVSFPTLPDYITLTGPFLTSVVGEGIKVIGIYEFDESKYPEASKLLNERVAANIGVPGFTYSLTQWLEFQDALSLIGLA